VSKRECDNNGFARLQAVWALQMVWSLEELGAPNKVQSKGQVIRSYWFINCIINANTVGDCSRPCDWRWQLGSSCIGTSIVPEIHMWHTIMDREIIFEKVYSKTRKFILKCNLRYTSSIVGLSTRVKSAEHGKIFKTTSVTNLSPFFNNVLKPQSHISNDINEISIIKRNFFHRNTQNHVP